MQSVKGEFLSRLNEINDMLAFINDLEQYHIQNTNGTSIGISINTSIKSSVVLMLYNLIEATLTNTLKKLHEKINSHGVVFADASSDIRRLTLTYYYSKATLKDDIYSFSESLEAIISQIIENKPLNISFDELNKQYPLYSGNIDAQLIRKILKKYGLTFTNKSSELHSIKNYRNQLAHGERTFEECGREIPLQRLKAMYDATSNFINDMLLCVENFCADRNFLKND